VSQPLDRASFWATLRGLPVQSTHKLSNPKSSCSDQDEELARHAAAAAAGAGVALYWLQQGTPRLGAEAST
jgi:GTP cyclohydrolase II